VSVTSVLVLTWFSATAAIYWAMPDRLRPLVLIASTFMFLALLATVSAVLLVGLTLLTFGIPRLWRTQHAPLIAAMLVVLLLVGYKTAAARPALGGPGAVIIPLGLSYYTFRCIHYLIEHYKARLAPHGFSQFVSYLFFYPTIIAGPIHRFNEFQRDLRRRRWDARSFSLGCERILYGYVQIIVLGNWLVSVRLQPYIAGLDPSQQALVEYLECVMFGANIYFQFAGYSSVAIGFALVLGFRIIENFDHPFIRPNISAFWRCWHISLSSWCRDYVYVPVAASTRSVALGTVATMVVIGLWHELSPRYLAWGLYHAAGIVIWQTFQRVKEHLPAPQAPWARGAASLAGVALTFNFVMLSFAITKEPTLLDAAGVFATILGGWR
jgi:alginate O-acetyltransferase complex protein AlgI